VIKSGDPESRKHSFWKSGKSIYAGYAEKIPKSLPQGYAKELIIRGISSSCKSIIFTTEDTEKILIGGINCHSGRRPGIHSCLPSVASAKDGFSEGWSSRAVIRATCPPKLYAKVEAISFSTKAVFSPQRTQRTLRRP
jgi:hypothetical protein